MSLRISVQNAVKGVKTEAGQRSAAIRALAAAGHVTPPKVTVGRMDGNTLRVYAWDAEGGILLATGPKFEPKVFSPSDIQQPEPGVYILTSTDTRAQAKAARIAERRPVVSPAIQAAVKRTLTRDRTAAAKAIKKVRAHSREVVAEIPSSIKALESAERAELAREIREFLGS